MLMTIPRTSYAEKVEIDEHWIRKIERILNE